LTILNGKHFLFSPFLQKIRARFTPLRILKFLQIYLGIASSTGGFPCVFLRLPRGGVCDIIHLDERRKKSSGRSGARVFDKTFKALSDPTRRQILELLRKGPKSAGEISEQFGTSGATISHHLSVLKDAGLVSDEKRGKYIFYELDTSVLQDMLAWVAGFAKGDGDETKQ